MSGERRGGAPKPVGVSLEELRRRRGWPADMPPGPPVPVGETEDERVARLAVQNAARLARIRRYMRVQFYDADYSLLDQPTRALLRRWWDSGELSLVLTGGNGAGKSYAAAALLNLRHAAGDRVAWSPTITYCELVLPNPPLPDPGHLGDVRDADLTVVDDLGFEPASPGRLGALEALADMRSGEGLRSVWTTNLTRDDVAGRYSPRLLSRLGIDWHEMDGADRRLRARYRAARPW